MLARRIEDRKSLEKATAQHSDYFALFFWGEFSDAAQRALQELTEFAREYKEPPMSARLRPAGLLATIRATMRRTTSTFSF